MIILKSIVYCVPYMYLYIWMCKSPKRLSQYDPGLRAVAFYVSRNALSDCKRSLRLHAFTSEPKINKFKMKAPQSELKIAFEISPGENVFI